MEEGKGDSASAGSNTKRPHATLKERTVEVRETWSGNIHGIDNLTLAINSLDDHVQAGLQEVRNCVAALRHEKSELVKEVKSLSEVIRETSAQRDQYKEASAQLQQEIANLRNQLDIQRKDKEALLKRMQELQDQDEKHLESIAKTMRSQRLAHSTLVKWRKRVHEKNSSKALQLRVLEEENSSLRAELLLCQEAAKQAFLRSANALNSEAITMFQDAATRRLGVDEEDEKERERPSTPSSITSTSSSSSNPQNTQDKESEGVNKENVNKGRDRGNEWLKERRDDSECRSERLHHTSGVPKQRDHNVIYFSTFRGNNRDFAASQADSRAPRMVWRRADMDEYEEVVDSGSFSHYVRKPGWEVTTEMPEYRLPSPPPQCTGATGVSGVSGVSGIGGAIPKTRVPKHDIIPETLQREARARLQKLQHGHYLRPEPSPSSFEPLRKTKRVMPTNISVSKKPCSCQVFNPSIGYKCPFCTPIQNSDHGHYKPPKKPIGRETKGKRAAATVTHNAGMKSNRSACRDKKVIYNPDACTVLIEKHVNK